MTKLDEAKQEQRSMMLALVTVIAVLMLFNFFFPTQQGVHSPIRPDNVIETEALDEPTFAADGAPVVSEAPAASGIPLPMSNNLINGSFSTEEGGVFNQLNLTAYKETTAPDSPIISLLKSDYAARLVWKSNDIYLPQKTDNWMVSGEALTPFTPVVLTWESAEVRLTRTIALDDAYMLTLTDKVENLTSRPVRLALTGRISRAASDVPTERGIVHEGFIALVNGKSYEERYAGIEDVDDTVQHETTGGWMGMTDKYWQTIFILDDALKADIRFERLGELYMATFNSAPVTLAPKATHYQATRLFAGAKVMSLINAYEDAGVPKFDLSIDFGWFYFLTKPFLYFLNWLYGLVGNMGIAILIFATLLRILLLPIATKSYESMAKMKKIQPKIKVLQERFKDDRLRLQQEMMNLYKRDQVNPAAGCLPMLIQIPVFFALYKVLSVSILMRQAPFFGWIHDLSRPDPSSVLTLFGYLPWPVPSMLNIGVWPVLMGLTMWIQQKMNPKMGDATQQTMMTLMPVIFTFMLGHFAAGLVIYWTWSNILSIAQQKYIMKKVGV